MRLPGYPVTLNLMSHRTVRAVVLMLLLTVAALLIAVGTRRDDGPVLSVAQVLQRASRDPRGWQGKTVRVRGTVGAGWTVRNAGPDGVPLAGAAAWSSVTFVPLIDSAGGRRSWLWVRYGPLDGLAALLRRLPLLASLAPARRRAVAGSGGVYRVRLQIDAGACPHVSCVGGTLLGYTTTDP